ncbi:MAG TPA: hypothetical protein PK734_04180 [Bacteroidales bacterium]|nr:MAG: hypothetical protein BWY22_02189 [Bacteroidetes bacterium ADurb.Bin217]HPM12670.1 hypothetical protein [Bacteroidales bacterium]
MKTFTKFTTAIMVLSVLLFSSCKEDSINPDMGYSDGILVVCEGNFNGLDGDITYISDTSVTKGIFAKANGIPLGDIIQSLTIIDDKAYIVANNSQKIEVVDSKTFKSIGTITGLSFPRYVAKISDSEIAVSNGDGFGNNYIYFINTSTYSKIDSIAVGAGPNKMLIHNNKLYVANMGGWSNDKTISVITLSNKQVSATIEVGDLPADMELDKNNNIILLCIGLTTYDENWTPTIVSNSKLQKINTTDNSVTTIKEFDHQVANFSSNGLAYCNETIYYLDDAVYAISASNTTPIKLIDGYFYGLDCNPITKDIWVTSTPSTGTHKVIQFSPSGTKIKEYLTGFYPNAVVF